SGTSGILGGADPHVRGRPLVDPFLSVTNRPKLNLLSHQPHTRSPNPFPNTTLTNFEPGEHTSWLHTNKSKLPAATPQNPKAPLPPRVNNVHPKTPPATASSPKPSSSPTRTSSNSSASAPPTSTNTNPLAPQRLTSSSKSFPASGASTVPGPWKPPS